MPRFSGGTTRFDADNMAPFISIVPLLGVMNPAIIRSVVVLPQPDGPSSDTNSPSCNVRLTSWTAAVVPKFLPRFRNTSLLMPAHAAA